MKKKLKIIGVLFFSLSLIVLFSLDGKGQIGEIGSDDGCWKSMSYCGGATMKWKCGKTTTTTSCEGNEDCKDPKC